MYIFKLSSKMEKIKIYIYKYYLNIFSTVFLEYLINYYIIIKIFNKFNYCFTDNINLKMKRRLVFHHILTEKFNTL